MLLTIIPIDGNVKKDGVGYLKLDLSSCAIPSNVRVLQWEETSGWLEFWDKQNEDITELANQWKLLSDIDKKSKFDKLLIKFQNRRSKITS